MFIESRPLSRKLTQPLNRFKSLARTMFFSQMEEKSYMTRRCGDIRIFGLIHILPSPTETGSFKQSRNKDRVAY
jgi:hypothetical protein